MYIKKLNKRKVSDAFIYTEQLRKKKKKETRGIKKLNINTYKKSHHRDASSQTPLQGSNSESI